MLHGVDVSHWNGAYPWDQGEAFGFAKATEGTFYRDDQFKHNWDTMWVKKILRGAYHFGHPGTSPVAQADYFVSFVKAHGLTANDVLALDLEVSDGLPAAAVAAWAVAFVKRVESQTGKNVWLYANGDYIANGFCAGLLACPLWVANPSGTPGNVTVDIHPWPVWAVQQHAFGTGGKPDLDVLNGDAQVWEQLANLVQPVKYKTVTSKWVCQGQDSLTQLCASKFNGTSAAIGASTVLRLTLDNSPDKLFANDLAAYITAGDLATKPVPKGVTLYYPKRVKVS